MSEIKAKLRFLRQSPRKVRLVADLIRGKYAVKAVAELTVLNKKAARPIKKLLESAIANAKNNFNLDEKGLIVGTITVDDGPTLKRWTPRARGRATTIRKRTSHIELILKTKQEIEKKKEIKGEEKEVVEKRKKKVSTKKEKISKEGKDDK